MKANLVLGPWFQTELFANFGTGFHSNDARAVILEPILTALAEGARRYEFGLRTPASPRLQLPDVLGAQLSSELAFVGDEGTTEALGPSRRLRCEFSTRVEAPGLAHVHGRLHIRGPSSKRRHRPLSPRTTACADLTARLPLGLSASLAMRYRGSALSDGGPIGERRGLHPPRPRGPLSLQVLEAFVNLEEPPEPECEEVQFFYTSRLPGEPAEGVADIHFTPGAPFSVFGGLAVRF